MDPKVQKELRDYYNPNGSDLREYQLSILRILVEFDAFCKEHNLTYSLAYGTLLGAVRHQGFIPWDDDIDILMTRDQYNAFLAVIGDAENTLLKDDLYVRTQLKPEIYIKGVGIVDLFIIDYIPKNRIKQWLKRTTIQLLQWLYRCRAYYESWKNGGKPHFRAWQIMMPIGICLSLKQWQHLWDKTIAWFLSKKAINEEWMCCYTSPVSYMSTLYPSELFNEKIEVDFEGCRFMAMKGYDKYLTIQYGDYMKLPESIHNHGRI